MFRKSCATLFDIIVSVILMKMQYQHMSFYQQLLRYEHVNVNIPYGYSRKLHHTAEMKRMLRAR